MASASPITDHDEIRRWVEENNGRPACVKGTGQGEDPGILRIDFDAPEPDLAELDWDTWFDWFERNELALLRDETGRFNKLIRRRSEG